MNLNILHTSIQAYISEKLNTSIPKILFKGTDFEGVSTQEIVEQIEAKQKCKDKLPTWYDQKNIYFPNKLNIEQTSSEKTAQYKSSLIKGEVLIDITGGFGVDCFYFAKKFKTIIHCEINTKLSEIVAHNFKELDVKNIQTTSNNGIEFVLNSSEKYDWIYSDPSRRNDVKGKVFLLNDCIPNIPENLEDLFKKTENILIKTSPILDLKSAINELNFVKEIHIVAVKNEVKELLFVLKKDYNKSIQIKTINIRKEENQVFNFEFESSTLVNFGQPSTYLYEPNAAILKSGGFKHISSEFSLHKLHPQSHLYTSDKHINFPGRVFEIEHLFNFDKKKIKQLVPNGKANITTRNFPQSVAEIRKKTKLKEGGSQYLFFTTNVEGKHIVLLCKKV